MTEQEPQREGERPPDPSGIEEPHDVLAAEEFGIGTRDERYPADPTGIDEPHDVLAAEEFAMPTAERPAAESGRRSVPGWAPAAVLAAALVAVAVLRRRS
jgi:hypothetical protein